MFDLEPEEARLLLYIALMAVGQNRFDTASKMLAALKGYRPKAEALAVAEAVLLLSRGATDDAIRLIEEEQREDRFPGSAMLAVFKGMAYLKTNRLSEAHDVLQPITEGNDPVASQMAKDLLT